MSNKGMEPKPQYNDSKMCYNILQNKLKNLKEYDSKYGTKILESIGSNICTAEDVLSKQLNGVSLSLCANNKYLAKEVDTVANIYSDLLTRIANNQTGCGNFSDDPDAMKQDKDLNKFRRDFISLIGKNAKRGRKSSKKSKLGSKKAAAPRRHAKPEMHMGEGFGDDMTMSARKKRASKTKKSSKKSSKKMRSSHILF